VGDAAAKALSRMPSLVWIGLQGTAISDGGVEALGELKGLRYLFLDETKITNSAIKSLSRLPTLRYLSLRNTIIDDAGAESLAHSRSLREVVLTGTNVSSQMKKKMRIAGIEIS
jgi:internalin A